MVTKFNKFEESVKDVITEDWQSGLQKTGKALSKLTGIEALNRPGFSSNEFSLDKKYYIPSRDISLLEALKAFQTHCEKIKIKSEVDNNNRIELDVNELLKILPESSLAVEPNTPNSQNPQSVFKEPPPDQPAPHVSPPPPSKVTFTPPVVTKVITIVNEIYHWTEGLTNAIGATNKTVANMWRGMQHHVKTVTRILQDTKIDDSEKMVQLYKTYEHINAMISNAYTSYANNPPSQGVLGNEWANLLDANNKLYEFVAQNERAMQDYASLQALHKQRGITAKAEYDKKYKDWEQRKKEAEEEFIQNHPASVFTVNNTKAMTENVKFAPADQKRIFTEDGRIVVSKWNMFVDQLNEAITAASDTKPTRGVSLAEIHNGVLRPEWFSQRQGKTTSYINRRNIKLQSKSPISTETWQKFHQKVMIPAFLNPKKLTYLTAEQHESKSQSLLSKGMTAAGNIIKSAGESTPTARV